MSTISPTPKDAQKIAKSANGTNGTHGDAELPITLNVPPRQPRLAWQGMERKELADYVPTQVVEIVRPGKAVATDDKLPGITKIEFSTLAA